MKAVQLIGGMFALAACSHVEPLHPTRYIIAGNTVGWVTVVYTHDQRPALSVEDGFSVIHIPDDRKATASNRMNPSWDGSEFYYQNGDGKRVRLSTKDDDQRMIWGMEKDSDSDGDREVFFVGKQNQFTHISNAAGDMNTGLSDAKPPELKKGLDTTSDRTKVETELPK